MPTTLSFTGELASSGGKCGVQQCCRLVLHYISPVVVMGMVGDVCLNYENDLVASICTPILNFKSSNGVPLLKFATGKFASSIACSSGSQSLMLQKNHQRNLLKTQVPASAPNVQVQQT